MAGYDPFAAGPHDVATATLELVDERRALTLPCDIWSPRGGASGPLVVYSHHSGGHRRVATFLVRHLASHGYTVAAVDHSEVVDPALRGREGETREQRAARVDAIIAARVPDILLVLAHMPAHGIDAGVVGLVGHSFGGWAVLAAADVEPRVASVVAHAPGGSESTWRPGLLPLHLSFAWERDLPVLYLAGDADVPVPLRGVVELFDRTPSARKRLLVLHGADHQHFVDDVETVHESLRAEPMPPEVAWLTAEMRPAAELCSGEAAHRLVRGLTLAHLDATLRESAAAEASLASQPSPA